MAEESEKIKSFVNNSCSEKNGEEEIHAAETIIYINRVILEDKEIKKLQEEIKIHKKLPHAHRRKKTLNAEESPKRNQISALLFDGYKYNPPHIPPIPCLKDFIGNCSKPFEKQLTDSDLRSDQNRLSLHKSDVQEFLLPLLNEKEDLRAGIQISAYDTAGKKYPMGFKIWAEKYYVLNGAGWKAFITDHELRKLEDFVTIWMFRHSHTDNLCFVLAIRKMPVSKLLKKNTN